MIRTEIPTAREARRTHWLAGLGEAGFMMIASGAALGDLPSPFAAACAAAALAAGHSPAFLLIGCALGCDWFRFGLAGGAPLLASAFAYCLWLLATARFPVWFDERRDAAIALMAGIGQVLAAVLLSGFQPDRLPLALGSGALALCVAPVLISAARLDRDRRELLPEERIALGAVAFIALLALAARAPVLMLPFAGAVTLAFAAAGASAGATAGLLLGAVAAMTGVPATACAALGLSGLLAGLTRPFGRIWMALCFVSAQLAAFSIGLQDAVMHPVAACIVGACAGAIPETALDALARTILPPSGEAPETYLAVRMREMAGRRLTALASVFSELATGYGDVPAEPDETALIARMRRRLCSGCPGYDACWNGGNPAARRLFCTLLCDALRGQPLTETDALPPEQTEHCRRAAAIPLRLGGILREFGQQRAKATRRRTAARILSRHFDQTRDVLLDVGASLEAPATLDPDMSRRIRLALEVAGFAPDTVVAVREARYEVTISLRDEAWSAERAQTAARALSLSTGMLFHPCPIEGDAPLRLLEAARLRATIGYASRARDQDAPCGDSHLVCGLPGGRVLLALSDGMGCGERAAAESAGAIRLLRRFMTAGVGTALTMDVVNQMLLLRGGDEMFATADICVLDLCAKTASFVKMGACASIIVRGTRCLRVDGGRLPLGILDSVRPGTENARLRPGDLLVMFTDGVGDCASATEMMWLEAQALELAEEAPGQFCKQIIRRVQERDEGIRDDITVLAARIERQ